ncbi:MAG: hypothetical protein GEV03_15830 [Streptosporangiales bacterium]|nr:hypothetical protein [Streptosporangiales bacterium]
MAQIVLGIGTSHTPVLALPPEKWATYAKGDRKNPELVFPPNGWVMSFEEGVRHTTPEIRNKPHDLETFRRQSESCQSAIDVLADTLRSAKPDITVIISDDQDEWFFENNMPMFSVYWGETVPWLPRKAPPFDDEEMARMIVAGYGDVARDVPVASAFGRFLIEYLVDHEFDVAHFNYVPEESGGLVARRYPTETGEIDSVRDTPPRKQGIPHGFGFVLKRLFRDEPGPILPVFQNTCYPPNSPTPRRCVDLGHALGKAIDEWDQDARVAVIASGGLSHFVVDEEIDRTILGALERKDLDTLRSLPRHRLYSATSESLNWVTLGGVLQGTQLEMELVAYVPGYRTEAGTGGGWAFARWQ